MKMKKYFLIATLLCLLAMFTACSAFDSSSSDSGASIDMQKSTTSINKGLILQAQKRYDDALEAFRAAIEYDRFNTEAYFYAAYVSFLLKDLEGSYYYAKKSIKIDPDFADGYLIASQVLLTRKKYVDALSLLAKLTLIKPKETNHLYTEQFTVYYRMGICYIGLAQYKRGLESLKKSVSLANSHTPPSLVRSAKDMIRKVQRRLH